ncbi:MAG: tetratricopeptide repeat protein [Bacteroidota bacterium]|nr:tetratricopeptide repeat protein [Bacteroidota bacterium]
MKPDEFRIFISSTFRDLMPEREQLVKKVCPQIRALCRERGVEFTEIDLRWGITDEEAHSGRTVRICLEEIDKCRPYFLGIIGSRYGWIPGSNVLELDEQLYKDYPWIAEYGRENKSITEMEFSHGAILPGNKNHAFIYEQEIIRDEANAVPIAELRSRITNASVPYHTFASPQELGEQVLRDLTSVLDRDWPQKKEMTPAERERLAHEAFARNRTHSYIANPEYSERFEKFVASIESPLILWGKSGFGKSALMAHLTSEHKHHHPEAFIIRHFVGATAGGSSSDDVMRHIMLEIKEHYELTDELPQTNLQEELPLWLGKIREGEKLVLAIDAVNQLTGIGNEMHWLPEFIPANVRLIISTTPELPLEQLRKRNWQEMEILPLTSQQKMRITKEFLARYHKSLEKEQLEILATEEKLESPLFLRTLLEELRIFGVHSAVEMQLATYLGCQSEAELFQTVLGRMEHDHGEETVKGIMKAIWASRNGLSETELLEITGLTRLALSEFLIALEFHLMRRGGLFTFFHNYLREAVEKRYAATESAKKEIHRHLATYFSGEPYDARRRDEEPWQWQAAEDAERFRQCIADIPMLELLLDESRLQELIGYWVELQKNFDLAETYHHAMAEYRAKCTDEEYFAGISGKLGSALVSASNYKEAEYHLKAALDLRKKLFGENDLKTAQSMNDLATLYYHNGNFKEAESLLKSVVGIREKILDPSDPTIAKALNDLGTILFSQGKLDEAAKCFQDALGGYQRFFRIRHPEIASTLSNLGTISYFTKKYDHAIDYFTKSIKMYEEIYGVNSIATIFPMSNLAMAHTEAGNYGNAEELLIRTIVLMRSFYGNYHNAISSAIVNLGVLYSKMNQYAKAIEMHREAIQINERVLGQEHFLTINSYLSLGMNLYRIGELVEGRKIIEHYLPLQEEKLGSNHQMVKVQQEAWKELLESHS